MQIFNNLREKVVRPAPSWPPAIFFFEACGDTYFVNRLGNAAWKIFGFQFDAAVAERDDLLATIERRLGQEVASQIQRHVNIAVGKIQADAQPNPAVMKLPEFYELLALELAIKEIADRIDATGKALSCYR